MSENLQTFACWCVGLLLALCAPYAHAGGARFIAGQGWGVPAASYVVWSGSTLSYYTDQGPLSPNVSHAQADAMVAAAARVWNVPTSSIALAQGGTLAEDVGAGNTYFDGTQVVFPPDVRLSNERNVPVAIVYDVDGSVIDMLLGQDASEPDGCRDNAVVGDVDDIHQTDGTIRHATLILNGRCVASAPEQLTQMQYQLARAFGRVLGLSWSQTNDNVFTGQKTVTANQMAYWPLMHPIDVICVNYSYQCMTNPFSLRVDDLNTLAQVYPVFQSTAKAGQQDAIAGALWLWGILYFPTGQGMGWVNVTTRRQHAGIDEGWQTVSGITGYEFQQAIATPVNKQSAQNSGSTSNGLDGYFSFRRIPLNGLSNVFVTTEPINPLYTGEYAIGPYVRPPAAPSGSPVTNVEWSALSAGDQSVSTFMTATDAAAHCNPGHDGSETAPATLDSSGWQDGLLCGWGHSSWWTVSAAAGHSWTLEVTATDETGAASVNKAQPVLGVWNAGDATGILPTVASAAVPFNSMMLGVTQMQMNGANADARYRFSVTDQYGAGRPDFTYVARLLYAASVSPASIGSGGGQIVITGSGFRQGNQVLINGALARVVSWSATQIVANAPSMSAAGAIAGVPATVTVLDTSTNGSATIPNALGYVPAPNLLQQVSAPAALETGFTAAVPLAVRVLASDGLSPVPNALVSFAVTGGSAQLGLCDGEPSCTGTTDSNGVVQTTVTGAAAGAVTLSAIELSGGATVQVTIADVDPVRSAALLNPVHYVAAGASGTWTVQLSATQDGRPAMGAPVSWSFSAGLVAEAGDVLTGIDGSARQIVTAQSVAAGSVNTVTACVWSTVCVSWTMYGVDPSQWIVHGPQNSAETLPVGSPLSTSTLSVTDLAGHAIEDAPVQVFQRVLAYEGLCATNGRCAAAPVLAADQSTIISDASGKISVVPLAVSDVPQVLQIAASSGATGFATLTITRTP